MKKDIQLIVTDLDGTLIDGKLRVSDQDRQTLDVLKDIGIPVVPATGRGLRSAEGVIKNLPLSNYIICFGGAALFCDEKVIWHTAVGNCLPYYEILKQREISNIAVFHEHADGVKDLSLFTPKTAEWAYTLEKYGGEVIRGEKIPWAASQDLTKMVYFAGLEELQEVQVKWLEIGTDKHIVLSSDYTLDITHADARKGEATRILALEMGISMENVMAIGDNFNDYDLIKEAGFGVAMGTAPDGVKKIADYVTDSVKESGFSQAVHKFVLG